LLQALGSPTKMLNTGHDNQNDIMFAKYGVSAPHTLTNGHRTMNDEIGLPTNYDINCSTAYFLSQTHFPLPLKIDPEVGCGISNHVLSEF
jgi:hypothetical protein